MAEVWVLIEELERRGYTAVRAARIAERAVRLQEARFTPSLHPRDRLQRFRDVPGKGDDALSLARMDIPPGQSHPESGPGKVAARRAAHRAEQQGIPPTANAAGRGGRARRDTLEKMTDAELASAASEARKMAALSEKMGDDARADKWWDHAHDAEMAQRQRRTIPPTGSAVPPGRDRQSAMRIEGDRRRAAVKAAAEGMTPPEAQKRLAVIRAERAAVRDDPRRDRADRDRAALETDEERAILHSLRARGIAKRASRDPSVLRRSDDPADFDPSDSRVPPDSGPLRGAALEHQLALDRILSDHSARKKASDSELVIARKMAEEQRDLYTRGAVEAMDPDFANSLLRKAQEYAAARERIAGEQSQRKLAKHAASLAQGWHDLDQPNVDPAVERRRKHGEALAQQRVGERRQSLGPTGSAVPPGGAHGDAVARLGAQTAGRRAAEKSRRESARRAEGAPGSAHTDAVARLQADAAEKKAQAEWDKQGDRYAARVKRMNAARDAADSRDRLAARKEQERYATRPRSIDETGGKPLPPTGSAVPPKHDAAALARLARLQGPGWNEGLWVRDRALSAKAADVNRRIKGASGAELERLRAEHAAIRAEQKLRKEEKARPMGRMTGPVEDLDELGALHDWTGSDEGQAELEADLETFEFEGRGPTMDPTASMVPPDPREAREREIEAARENILRLQREGKIPKAPSDRLGTEGAARAMSAMFGTGAGGGSQRPSDRQVAKVSETFAASRAARARGEGMPQALQNQNRVAAAIFEADPEGSDMSVPGEAVTDLSEDDLVKIADKLGVGFWIAEDPGTGRLHVSMSEDNGGMYYSPPNDKNEAKFGTIPPTGSAVPPGRGEDVYQAEHAVGGSWSHEQRKALRAIATSGAGMDDALDSLDADNEAHHGVHFALAGEIERVRRALPHLSAAQQVAYAAHRLLGNQKAMDRVLYGSPYAKRTQKLGDALRQSPRSGGGRS